jgi:small subunit ribosomal protein S4e
MARGPRKHMKRLNAPKKWMLSKMGGIWAPRPSQGPHKLRECLPLCLVIRNRLKYALNRSEVLMIVMRRLVQVDGKVRTDMNFPTGIMDVISLPNSGEHFRVLYDVKGRFVLHRIHKDEALYKLCRVKSVSSANKASIGFNPLQPRGKKSVVPYCNTHDGRTIRYVDPLVKPNDTVRVELSTGKILESVRFEVGNMAMVTKGANTGRIGVISSIERHLGGFDIIHLKDKAKNEFATRMENVFVIGEGTKNWISLPKGKGVRKTIQEEQDARMKESK